MVFTFVGPRGIFTHKHIHTIKYYVATPGVNTTLQISMQYILSKDLVCYDILYKCSCSQKDETHRLSLSPYFYAFMKFTSFLFCKVFLKMNQLMANKLDTQISRHYQNFILEFLFSDQNICLSDLVINHSLLISIC